jgi:hypothetical protein
MKNAVLAVLMTFTAAIAQAQLSNAVLFTEEGERFTVILNGLKQNESPETNVRLTGLNAEFYKMKVIFQSASIGERNFNLNLQLGMENTFAIKKNKKGEYVLRFVSAVPVDEAPRNIPAPVQPPVQAATPPPPPINPPAGAAVSQSVTTTTQTTTTGNGMPSDAVNFQMGVNVNGQGGNINIQMSGMDPVPPPSTTTTVTHSQTITTSQQPAPVPVPPPAPVVYLPGYNGPIGCPVPMTDVDFRDLEQSISTKKFEDSKLTIAKQVLRDRCLFVSQVKRVLSQFTFEETKLEFAKYAYVYTYDIGNYFKVNDVFTFESTIEELDAYIRTR